MRKLVWFVVGFTAACGLGAYLPEGKWMFPVILICLILFPAGLLLGRKWKNLRRATAVCLGCAVGLGWFLAYHSWFLSPLERLDGQERYIEFTASDYSYETDYGVGVDGILTVEEKSYQIRAYLEEGTMLSPGDQAAGIFRLRLTTPDAREASAYYQGEGVFLLAYQRGGIGITRAEEVPTRYFPAVLRLKIKEILTELFPEDASPFAKALLLGDTSDLDYETDTAFRISGIRHIIAVSGLHVSILYGLISLITFRRRFLTAAVGLPVLLLFAAVAGFTPSVTRACIMVCLMLLASVFEREYDAPAALSFSVLVMLGMNPLAVTSISLQLSVSCVAGILLFNAPISGWLKGKIPEKKGILGKLRNLFCGSVSVSLSAMSLVMPLTAYYFGMVSLVGVVTNLLTLWVVNLIFNGLAAVCLLYPLLPGLAWLLASLQAWPIRYVLLIAKTLAELPLTAVYMDSVYTAAWLVFVYLLLAIFLLSRKKQPGVLLSCGALGLCLVLLASWAEPLLADTRITMLDVGQGQSILLQSEGKTYLVDCGGDDDEKTADIIAEALFSQGIQGLDGIILTHYDRDHAGAVHNLLTRVDVDYLFLPDTRNEMTPPEMAGQTVYVWEDLELSFGASRLVIYGPVYSGLDNENSLCVLFDTEKCDILITGDRSAFGERMLMRHTQLPDVDILVAGHHGAADSTSVELLQQVTPETVLISVAQDNIYGHPAGALLQRLAEFGCAVYRTDLHGTITIGR